MSAYIGSPSPVPFGFAGGPPVQGVIATSEATLYGSSFAAFGGFAPGSNLAIFIYDAAAVPAGPYDPITTPPAMFFSYDPGGDPRLVLGPDAFGGEKGVKFTTGIAWVAVDFSGGGPPQPAFAGPAVASFLANIA
jgi:hypothetical protein